MNGYMTHMAKVLICIQFVFFSLWYDNNSHPRYIHKTILISWILIRWMDITPTLFVYLLVCIIVDIQLVIWQQFTVTLDWGRYSFYSLVLVDRWWMDISHKNTKSTVMYYCEYYLAGDVTTIHTQVILRKLIYSFRSLADEWIYDTHSLCTVLYSCGCIVGDVTTIPIHIIFKKVFFWICIRGMDIWHTLSQYTMIIYSKWIYNCWCGISIHPP